MNTSMSSSKVLAALLLAEVPRLMAAQALQSRMNYCRTLLSDSVNIP